MKIEGFVIELNLRRKKYLLRCSYNPSHHLKETHKDIDVLTWKSDIILMGGFNAEPVDTIVSDNC